MNKIIGVIYHMGLVLMPSYRQYCWQKAMCRDRFLAILSFLHFGDGDETYTYDLKLETMRKPRETWEIPKETGKTIGEIKDVT